MDSFKWYFQQQIPNYLKSLPLPSSLGGFAALSREQWLQLAPFVLFLAVLVWLLLSPVLSPLCSKKKARPKHIINKKVNKDEPKIVTKVDIEDVAEDKAYCRCWKSKTFPICDGSHNQHNTDNRDNVGPLKLVVAHKEQDKKKKKKGDN